MYSQTQAQAFCYDWNRSEQDSGHAYDAAIENGAEVESDGECDRLTFVDGSRAIVDGRRAVRA